MSGPRRSRRTILGNRRTTIVGGPPAKLGDLYHRLLDAPWTVLHVFMLVTYAAANAVFACFYLALGDVIENAIPGSFADAFFFSVQTMATIGYGKMVPRGHAANVLVTIEAVIGLLGFAMATGLLFAKFAKPTARVLFSKHALVTVRDGVPSLLFRMANERFNQIAEAECHVSMARSERTKEGEPVFRFYDLPLVRSRTSVFALTWTVVHPIDDASPLAGVTPDWLKERGAIVVSVTGLDETFAQTIHARHIYTADDVRFGHRFVDIMHQTPEGEREMHYHRFHETEPDPAWTQE